MIDYELKIKEMKEIQKKLDADYRENIDTLHLDILIDCLVLTLKKTAYHYSSSMSGVGNLETTIDVLKKIRETIN